MKKISIIFLITFLVIGAYFSISGYNLYDSKRILQIGVFTLIGVALLFRLINHSNSVSDEITLLVNAVKNRKNVWLRITILIFVVSTLISIINSNYSEKAVVDVLLYLVLIFLSFLIAPRFLKQHYFLGRAIIVAATLYVGIYVIVFTGNYIESFFNPLTVVWPNKLNISVQFGDTVIQGKELLYFVNRRFFNHTQTWTFPLIIGTFVFFRRSENYNTIAPVLLVFITIWWALLYQTGGRGATISLFVSAFLLFLITAKDFKPLIKPLIFSSVVGWLFKYLIFDLPFSEAGQSLFRSQHSRFYRIEGALKVWWEKPLFGIGPGHYAEIGPTQFVGHPHNFYLQILSEYGVFAFIALAALFLYVSYCVYKKFKETKPLSDNRLNFMIMSWSMLASLCYAFFSGVMHTPLSQVWFILILSWLFGFFKRGKSVELHGTENISILVYLTFLSIIIYLIYPEILSLPEMYEAYFDQYPDKNLKPRFWGQGLFPIE